MGRYERTVAGVVVGAVGVMVVGEGWHVGEGDGQARRERAYTIPALPGARLPDDGPHRESRGTVMLRYPTMVASTATGTILTAAVGADYDLGQVSVPITIVDGRFVFGREFRSA